MRIRIGAVHVACSTLLLLLCAGCGSTGPTGGAGSAGILDRLEKLPALPPDVASTLDPKTSATRIRPSQLAPVLDPAAPLAPCCGSKDQKTLKVRVSLTKCGPLRDFILAPIGDLLAFELTPAGGSGGTGGTGGVGGLGGAVGPAGNVRMYRRGAVNRTRALDTIVCMSSDGPWDATFTEERNCNGYQPQDSLLVSGWGGLVGYFWNGGVSNHPPEIQLVSCREIGTFRFPCNALSGCDCSSSPCPAEQPCECTLQW